MMWTVRVWNKRTRKWVKAGTEESTAKTELFVRGSAADGFVCQATHTNGEKMTAYPHNRGFAYYRPLEKT